MRSSFVIFKFLSLYSGKPLKKVKSEEVAEFYFHSKENLKVPCLR